MANFPLITENIEPKSEASRASRAIFHDPGLGDAYRMSIHHTATPTNDSMSPPARLRSIQNYHQNTLGWCDIGYHYLMSSDGRLWQGRPSNLIGAHTGGSNTGNLGIAVMGSHDSTPITSEQVDKLAGLIRDVADEEG